MEPNQVHPNILTTHVLDTAKGIPVHGLRITLAKNMNYKDELNFQWEDIGETTTNSDGRGPEWLHPSTIASFTPGIYKAIFHTKEYFDRYGTPHFYPIVEIVFRISDVTQHYHIPLNISPFGYSTYRGS